MAESILKMLFYNSYGHASFRDASDLKAGMDQYYLMTLPWFHLHGRNVEAFRRDGDRTTIRLEGNAVADIDWAKLTYSVTIDGSEVARDLASFCPIDENRIAFYAVSSRELTATLSRNWNPSTVVAYRLSTEARTEAPVKVQNGRLTVAVNAQEPVIVYRSAESSEMK